MNCTTCNKPYELNKSIEFLKNILTEKQLENIKYIPSCNCLDEKEKEMMILEEKKLDRERKHNRIKKFKDISVVDSKFDDARFENADMTDEHMKPCLKYAENFLIKDTSLGMALFGQPGNGKTFATACIGNYLMDAGKTVLALSVSSYLTKLKEFNKGEENLILKYVSECDLLIIDDLGSEFLKKDESWTLEKIFMLIDTRYRANKPLIISTNLGINEDPKKCELTKFYTCNGKPRISDRIKEMCYPMLISGNSRRVVKRDEFRDFIGY